jgi:hypothetical protein
VKHIKRVAMKLPDEKQICPEEIIARSRGNLQDFDPLSAHPICRRQILVRRQQNAQGWVQQQQLFQKVGRVGSHALEFSVEAPPIYCNSKSGNHFCGGRVPCTAAAKPEMSASPYGE